MHHAKARVLSGRGELKIEPEVPAMTSLPSWLFIGPKIVPCTEPYSPPPLDHALEPGEMFKGNSHFVKIVVTKRQLESMLRDGKDIPHIGDIAVRLLEKPWVEEECPKWRPSLVTIPEVQKF
ncbi:hypothetical protein CDL15_Pgr012786 [Punica granatum]|nr:hypothetical protein CDL15_Pgr012786 [Punica granatum]